MIDWGQVWREGGPRRKLAPWSRQEMMKVSRQRPRREGLGRTQGRDMGFIHSLSSKVSLMAACATLFVHGDAASKAPALLELKF